MSLWLAATEVPVDASMGVLAALLALTLVWTHRSRFVPFWLPAESWHELERREPGSGTRLSVVGPPPPGLEAPEVEQAPPPEDLNGALLTMQGEFEASMHKFTAAAEAEWTELENQLLELYTRYQVVRGQLTDSVAGKDDLLGQAAERGQVLTRREWADVERAQPPVTATPEEPPVELSGTGWSEPDDKGLRTRSDGTYFEYLGAPNDPGQPASGENPRPYYREARPEGFVEIARGVVAGKRLLITDCSRFPEKLELQGSGLDLEPGGQLFGEASRSEIEALERALWALPPELRKKPGQFMFAADLGGRLDWVGRYRADEEGYPRSNAALILGQKIWLRADLAARPRLLSRALRSALGAKEPVAATGDHAAYRWVEL